MINVCVSGSKGKMGTRISALAKDDAELNLSGGFDAGDDAEAGIKECDCLIEFSTPEATMKHLSFCEKYKKAFVIGTTGLSDEERVRIKEASKKISIVFSPNMSIGVNVLFQIVTEAAKVLGSEYEVSILEAHHAEKKDAPSGTAKELAKLIKGSRSNGDIDIPIESIREDEIVGEHTVTFESPFDVIELTHSAKTRDIFAKGALAAAKFAASKENGLFTMKDVLGL